MTIQKVIDTTEICAGQWALEVPPFYDSLFGRPRKVVKASGQRIYLTDQHGEDYGHFVARKSVLYVCDTREEADSMYQISERHYESIKAAREAVFAESAALITCAIGETA